MLRYSNIFNLGEHDPIMHTIADITLAGTRGQHTPEWVTSGVKADDPVALTYLAEWHLTQHQGSAEVDKALSLLVTAAEKGYPPAQIRLALVYILGLGHNVDYVAAHEWLEKAAEHEMAEADLLLGMMYSAGLGVDANHDEALRRLKNAAKNGYRLASRLLPSDDSFHLLPLASRFMLSMMRVLAKVMASTSDINDGPLSHSGILDLAKTGDPEAQLLLALFLFKGEGLERNETEAAIWCQKAAEGGDAVAGVIWGLISLLRQHPDTDYAMRLLNSSGYGDLPPVQKIVENYRLLLHREGLSNEASDEIAELDLLLHSALRRVVLTKLNGMFFGSENPLGEEAYFEKIIAHGDAEARLALALEYLSGIEREANKSRGYQLLQLAAEQGQVPAQWLLAIAYLNGKDLETDTAKALIWLRAAAENDLTLAQQELVFLHLAGKADALSEGEVFHWSLVLAQKGKIESQIAVVGAYSKGKGVPQDLAKAMYWLRKAAENGDSMAQLMLGQALLRGKGVAQNIQEAKLWLSKAADQGFEPARDALAAMGYQQT